MTEINRVFYGKCKNIYVQIYTDKIIHRGTTKVGSSKKRKKIYVKIGYSELDSEFFFIGYSVENDKKKRGLGIFEKFV